MGGLQWKIPITAVMDYAVAHASHRGGVMVGHLSQWVSYGSVYRYNVKLAFNYAKSIKRKVFQGAKLKFSSL